MLMNVSSHYLDNMKKLYRYYKVLAEKAMQQLEPQQLLYSHNEETNSIATIVKHMHGNMLSRWTDFLTTDGEKPNRNRDGEFMDEHSIEQIMTLWERGWERFFETMDALQPDDLLREITIRNEPHTLIQALERQTTHYGAHVGQIILLAKHLAGDNWKTLSIPRGKSNEYLNTPPKPNN